VGVFYSLIEFIVNWLWFKELNYVSVFFTKLFSELKIGVPTFLVITVLAYAYLMLLKKSYVKNVSISVHSGTNSRLNLTAFGLSAAFGGFIAYNFATKFWFDVLQFINSTSFGIKDPLFNRDVGFYVFKLQLLQNLDTIGIGLVIAFAVLTLVFYTFLISNMRPQIFEVFEETYSEDEYEYAQSNFEKAKISFSRGDFAGAIREFLTPKTARKQHTHLDNSNISHLFNIARGQFTILAVLLLLLVGFHYYLNTFSLLYSGNSGVVYGAGYADVNITLWVYRGIAGLSIIASFAVILSFVRKKYKMAFVLPIFMLVIAVGGTAITLGVQEILVKPDEINKESRYLKNNIKYTQEAYGLADVQIKPFAVKKALSKEDILNNMETISNIRINDYAPAEKFYNQTQSIRSYYNFNDVDVDRYMIDGEYTQVFLAGREIDESKIRTEWLNKYIKYTHGYGITLSRVDKVTDSGQPDMLISGVPPVSEVDEIQIKRPEIYFGELATDYILVNTAEDEFDYPDGSKNKYTKYKGTAGIKLSPFNRLLFAIRENSLKMLISTNVKSDSKIVINRNIANRVRQVMPYLNYDKDPYIVTVNGKLYWMIDAYTVTNKYPYSQPAEEAGGANYIRNSVKVVVDAYDGNVDYYIVDDKDPIAQTYQKIFPKLFKDFSQMPEELRSHIRYPNVMFNIQANVYKRYHMNDVKVFYQDEDIWDIAHEIYEKDEVSISPNYYIMKLPGENKAEFVNTVPYTPKNKRNMTGLLVARNDGADYGKLVLYQFPKDTTIYGPMQIEAQIDQNTEISKEFSLWNSSGSTYSRGNLFIIPIEESLLYVEPVYLEATKESIPEVKRVIVAYGDKIAYKPTLDEALDSLFGENSTQKAGENVEKPKVATEMTQSELISKATEAYDLAQEALRNGDWAGYGEQMITLEKYLKLLAE
ncbi:MAG: UPF0182 family membrane protein, partial [Eubacteriales bacterium]